MINAWNLYIENMLCFELLPNKRLPVLWLHKPLLHIQVVLVTATHNTHCGSNSMRDFLMLSEDQFVFKISYDFDKN